MIIERPLEVLTSEEEWLRDRQPDIAEKIERAFGQFERFEFFTAEQSRADMENRKAAWLREQQRGTGQSDRKRVPRGVCIAWTDAGQWPHAPRRSSAEGAM